MISNHDAGAGPAAGFQGVEEECDLVLKGGVTSGVVYPPAIIKLAGTYRFRGIGGTSAGAIAAAGAAAAEYGREQGGFEKLVEIKSWLSTNNNLLHLFQPAPATRALFNTLLELNREKEHKPDRGQDGSRPTLLTRLADLRFILPYGVRLFLRLHPALLLNDTIAAILGALAGVLLALGVARLVGGSFGGWGIALPILLGYLGFLGGSLAHFIFILLKRVPGNFYGLCTGFKPASGGPEALTNWLHARLNSLAGREPDADPLTFRDLKAKTLADGTDACIVFKLVTTNLSQGRPYVLPLGDHQLLFDEAAMRKLFPRTVVDHMVKNALPPDRELPKNMHFLPAGDDMPIVVATRLSLSFPLLLSAIPLYTFDAKDELQQNWFSDGGISSNFPIHIFDAWLPTRPTFGIKLVSRPAEVFEPSDKRVVKAEYQSTPPSDGKQQRPLKDVFLPLPREVLRPEWAKVDGLPAFIWSIFTTAQNYRDNTQSHLPSYRERICTIRFEKDEGGLNLDMDKATIKRIEAKGEEAAQELLVFGTQRFEEHRWVRLRVLMDHLEQELTAVKRSRSVECECVPFPQKHCYTEQIAKLREEYAALIHKQLERREQGPQAQWYCPEDQAWCDEALARIKQLFDLIAGWDLAQTHWQSQHPQGDNVFFLNNHPVPDSTLRVTPKL